MDGYESIARAIPRPPISIVHGKMKADVKTYERDGLQKVKIKYGRYYVIEVASIYQMHPHGYENAERFGLLKLHQLRGV